MEDAEIGVIGAGAWGTALAQMLASDGRRVPLWAFEPDLVDTINGEHANPLYLPGSILSERIVATSTLEELADLKAILLVTPAQHMRAVLSRLPKDCGAHLVLCSKGIEAESGQLMADVAAEAAPGNALAVLSGPTFAHEVAAKQPTAVTLACSSAQQWEELAPLVARPFFRPYYTDDVVGAEIGGAVKNVLAIACGVVDGLELGQNARAALISRGFAEMIRFGLACGARPETLTGLSGLGDLVLTCSSESSRNFSLGRAMGKGEAAEEVLRSRNSVAEGAFTAPVLQRVAKSMEVDMPIAEAVCNLLDGKSSAGQMVEELLSRPLKAE